MKVKAVAKQVDSDPIKLFEGEGCDANTPILLDKLTEPSLSFTMGTRVESSLNCRMYPFTGKLLILVAVCTARRLELSLMQSEDNVYVLSSLF